jgi:hypothetical protein
MTQAHIGPDLFEVGPEGAHLSWRPRYVVFEGRRYYVTSGWYYRWSGPYRPLSLHREIWARAHGPIPEWHHIHHVDFDPLNNRLSNLACLTQWDHALLHVRARRRQRRKRNGRVRQAA